MLGYLKFQLIKYINKYDDIAYNNNKNYISQEINTTLNQSDSFLVMLTLLYKNSAEFLQKPTVTTHVINVPEHSSHLRRSGSTFAEHVIALRKVIH